MAVTKWQAATSRTSGISSATINNAAGSLGSEIDNSANKDRFISAKLNFQHGTAPTGTWLLYLLYAQDGTNYEDGSGTVQPAKEPAAVFSTRGVTTAQIVNVNNIPLSPFKFKALIWNDTAQNSSTSSVTLTLHTHDEETA